MRFANSLFLYFSKHTPGGGGGEKMENLLAQSINTQDGHGGRAELHRSEMEEIARRIIAEERERLMEEINERIL